MVNAYLYVLRLIWANHISPTSVGAGDQGAEISHACVAYMIHDRPPTKNPGHQGSGEPPWLAVFLMCGHTLLLREISD